MKLELRGPCEISFYSAADSIGPNAFALPPCFVGVTDEFVGLAKNNQEIEVMLAHELGHIEHRHTLRHIVQSTFLTFLVVMMTGDATQISAQAALIPALLFELGYSRDFEREADRYARQYLVENDIPLSSFPAILQRLGCWSGADKALDEGCLKKMQDEASSPESEGDLSGYLSTHPLTEERAKLFVDP